MFFLTLIGLCMLISKSRSTVCPDLHPCSCTASPFLSIDCSNRNFSHDLDFRKLKGLYINHFKMQNISDNNLSIKHFEDLKVNKLDMSENSIRNLRQLLTVIDEGLEEINLDASNVDFDLLNVLRRFGNLTFLSLRRNNLDIKQLPDDLFGHLSDLKYLDLSYNQLNCGHELDIFRKLKALTVLNLKETGLDLRNYSCLEFLKNLKSLEYLNLANNVKSAYQKPIGPIFKDLNLASLKKLVLSSNEIIKFQDNAFDGVKQLEILDLSNNILPTIPSAVTSTLSNLTHLNVSSNRIIYIWDNNFANLTHLEYLNFRDNRIESFPKNTFKGLGGNLQTLDLSSNKLTGGYFWIAGLRPLRSLRELNISYNKIKHIQNDSFDSTPHLRLLDVSGNPISFTDTMFSGIESSLKLLYMRNIGLKMIPLTPLETLTKLDILDLSNNKLDILHNWLLKGVNAENIYLQNMKISNISKDAFIGIKSTISVYLDNNNISSLTFLDATTPCLYNMISLSNNPLACDCTAISVSASGRVGNVKGTCTNEEFIDISLHNISLTDEKLVRACKGLNVVTGRCSRTGRFISNSGENLRIERKVWNLLSCIILIFSFFLYS